MSNEVYPAIKLHPKLTLCFLVLHFGSFILPAAQHSHDILSSTAIVSGKGPTGDLLPAVHSSKPYAGRGPPVLVAVHQVLEIRQQWHLQSRALQLHDIK